MTNKEPYLLGAKDAVSAIQQGILTAEELVVSCIKRTKEIENYLKAWVCFNEELAMEQAVQIDSRIKKREDVGSLVGIPVGVKDIFNTRDMPTAMGSPIWEGFTPGNDARAVTQLRRAGAVIPGKTVTAEFAVHHPGPTLNPYHPDHMPGTSSSGSAVAVATGMVPVAIGTQTAGSTIRPASYCGVYGYKPSFGLVPRTGILKTLDTLDHVSWVGRNVDDIKLMLDLLRVRGRNYPLIFEKIDSVNRPKNKNEWKVAFVKTPAWSEAEGYTKDAMQSFVNALTKTGVFVSEENLPSCFDKVYEVHETVYKKALSYYFQEEYKNHYAKISDSMRTMIEEGQKISFNAYHTALEDQNRLSRSFEDFISDYDIVISHATASHAPKGLHSIEKRDPCLIWTLCRVPVLGAPAFISPAGLPFGVQLVSSRFNDYTLLAFGKFLCEVGLISDLLPVDPVGEKSETLIGK